MSAEKQNDPPFDLSDELFAQVRTAYQDAPNDTTRDRALCIMLIGGQGWSVAQAARFLGLAERTVNTYVAAWQGSGMASLRGVFDAQHAST
jgi:hypothetical protein